MYIYIYVYSLYRYATNPQQGSQLAADNCSIKATFCPTVFPSVKFDLLSRFNCIDCISHTTMGNEMEIQWKSSSQLPNTLCFLSLDKTSLGTTTKAAMLVLLYSPSSPTGPFRSGQTITHLLFFHHWIWEILYPLYTQGKQTPKTAVSPHHLYPSIPAFKLHLLCGGHLPVKPGWKSSMWWYSVIFFILFDFPCWKPREFHNCTPVVYNLKGGLLLVHKVEAMRCSKW